MQKLLKKNLTITLILGLAIITLGACKKNKTPQPNPLKGTTWQISAANNEQEGSVLATYAGATIVFLDAKNYTTTLDVAEEESGTYTFTLDDDENVSNIKLTANGISRDLTNITMGQNTLEFTLNTTAKGAVDFAFIKVAN